MHKNLFRSSLGLLACALLVACGGGGGDKAPAAASAPAASQSSGGGATMGSATIQGVATYDGPAESQVIKMDADPVCKSLHKEEVKTETIMKDAQGHLANVFVWVKSGLPAGAHYPVPTQAAEVNQQGCQYHPHVQGVMVGQKVNIVNSDPTLHNIHARPKENQEFNQGQPFQGMTTEHVFDKVEVPPLPFRCDVHAWMNSYMAVLDHPFFATSGADGSFSIAKLPAGTYTIEAWHEKLGTQEQQVTVKDGETVKVSFDFKAGK